MDQAYLACLQPQALAKYGAKAFTGHGLTLIQEKKRLPPAPKLVGRDQVADIHATQRGDKARKLARAARMLRLQLQAKTLGDSCGEEHATAALPVGGGCGAPCRNLPAAGACDGAPAGGQRGARPASALDAQGGLPFHTALRKLTDSLQREWQQDVFLGVLSLDRADNSALSWGLCAVAAQLEAAGRRADEAEAKRKRLALAGQLTGSACLKRAAGL